MHFRFRNHRLLDSSSYNYKAMHKGEEILPALAAISGELDKFSKIDNGDKLQVEIWTTTELLKQLQKIFGYNLGYNEVHVVMEAVYEIREALKKLQEKEQGVEVRLAELKRSWIKTVMKPLWKRAKEEQKRAKRERRGSIQKGRGKENRELNK